MGRRTWQFDQRDDEYEGVRILSLSGRLSRASAPMLEASLARPAPRGLVVDFRGLDYVSGAGLAAVRDAAARGALSGTPFVVCGLEGSVLIAFELAGLLASLVVEADRAQGLARIAASRNA